MGFSLPDYENWKKNYDGNDACIYVYLRIKVQSEAGKEAANKRWKNSSG